MATDIYFKETSQGYWLTNEESKYSTAFVLPDIEEKIYLATKIKQWYGLTDQDQINLINANDDEIPFFKIAGMLEDILSTQQPNIQQPKKNQLPNNKPKTKRRR